MNINKRQANVIGIAAFALFLLLMIHYPFDGYITKPLSGGGYAVVGSLRYIPPVSTFTPELGFLDWDSKGAMLAQLSTVKSVLVAAIIAIASGILVSVR